MQQTNATGWLVYTVDNDGSVLFLGILPTKEQAEREAEALAATMSTEYYVTGLPLLEWKTRPGISASADPPPRWLM
jgi:hypothetical protein